MPKAYDTWTVLPHRPIQKLSENLWRVVGSLPGMPIKRQMLVARMHDGGLVIHGGIALESEAMTEIEQWGTPAFILVPNGWHRLDSRVFKDRYPEAKLLCPEGSRKRISEVVQVDGTYEDFPSTDRVWLRHLRGSGDSEGVMGVRSAEGDLTLVFNDLIFNLPHQPGLFGLVYRLLGSTGGPKVTRIGRLFMVKDKTTLKDELEGLSRELGLARVVPAHGKLIDEDPAGALRSIAAAL